MEPTEAAHPWRRLEVIGLATVSAALALVLVISMAAIPPVIVFSSL